ARALTARALTARALRIDAGDHAAVERIHHAAAGRVAGAAAEAVGGTDIADVAVDAVLIAAAATHAGVADRVRRSVEHGAVRIRATAAQPGADVADRVGGDGAVGVGLTGREADAVVVALGVGVA